MLCYKSCFSYNRYLFRSGNYEQPSDRFYNTTVEVLPVNLSEDSPVWSTFNTTNDGYLVIGAFNDFGIAEGVIDSKIGELKELRLHVYSDSQNWVILREVLYIVFLTYTNPLTNIFLLPFIRYYCKT